MTSETGSLAQAVCQVMAQCNHVQKTGWNNHQRYKYASDADLLTTLQPAMAEAGLALLPHKVETRTVEHSQSGRGNTNWRTEVVVTWMLLHTSGESMTLQAPGCGVDGQDKGVYKAMTGALKYVLRHLFLVPTSDDPERSQPVEPAPDRHPERQPRRPQPPRERTPPQERPQPTLVITEAGQLPATLLAQLRERGWSDETLIEDLRDFAAWTKPTGQAFDPWAASRERLQKLPRWLDKEKDAITKWSRWYTELEEALGDRLTRYDLEDYLAARKRPTASRLGEVDRRRLLAKLREPGQVEEVESGLTVDRAGGGA